MKKSSRRRLIYVCLLHCSPRISYFYGIERKYTQSSLQLYSHFPCNCNGDVIRCRRPMITCNLLRRFLSDCHQTVLQCLPWSLSLLCSKKNFTTCRAKENIYNTFKLILHDSSMVGCCFFFTWLEYQNSLYADIHAHRKYLFSLFLFSLSSVLMLWCASNWRIGNRVWEKGHHYNAIMRVVPGRFRGRVFPFCTALVGVLLQFSATIIILSARDLLVVL